jgi:hypothetical protein
MDLFFIISPFSFSSFLKIHLVSTTFLSLGLGTNFQVWFLSIWSSLSFIYFVHFLLLLAYLNDLGSIIEKISYSESNASFLLVSTVTHYFSHPGDVTVACVQAPKMNFLHERSDMFPLLQNLFLEGHHRPAIGIVRKCLISAGCHETSLRCFRRLHYSQVRRRLKTKKRGEIHESSRRNIL